MSKILYANGCSWTAGNGIPEDPLFPGTGSHENDLNLAAGYAWPEVLGKSLSYDVINQSLGAGSNARILRTTCNFIRSISPERYKDLLVVIGWSTVERDEIYLSNDDAPGDWYTFNAMQQFSTSRGNNLTTFLKDAIDDYQRLYVTHVHNKKINLMYYFQQMYLLSNLLENKGIKYLFFNSLMHHWGNNDNEYKEYTRELDSIKTNSIITDCSFSLFCRMNNLPLSWCIHPMIDGHKMWAGELQNRLTSLYGDKL